MKWSKDSCFRTRGQNNKLGRFFRVEERETNRKRLKSGITIEKWLTIYPLCFGVLSWRNKRSRELRKRPDGMKGAKHQLTGLCTERGREALLEGRRRICRGHGRYSGKNSSSVV